MLADTTFCLQLDQNFATSLKQDAILKEKYFFRFHSDNNADIGATLSGFVVTESEGRELTMNQIVNSCLLPLCEYYMTHVAQMDEATMEAVKPYLDIIGQRASGKQISSPYFPMIPADWIWPLNP